LASDGIDKIDLFFVGSLPEDTPISVANSGDGLDKWEWASVEKVLAGEYESWQVGILENILAKEERR
jgi:hypothetical protein